MVESSVAYADDGQVTCFWCHVGATEPEKIASAQSRALVNANIANAGVTPNKTGSKFASNITLSHPSDVNKCPLCPESGLHVCYPRLISGLKNDPGFQAFLQAQLVIAIKNYHNLNPGGFAK
jgi:hypothetical protein